VNILIIAPIPPPLTGNSIAVQVLYDKLVKHHKVKLINLSKGSLVQGINSITRVTDVIRILQKVWLYKNNADVIYLSISQSLAGNIRDIFIYLICFNTLSTFIIHLHGGGIKKMIFDKYRLLYKINKYFISRIGGVIVLGQSMMSFFSNIIPKNRIHIVPNFAEDYLFMDQKEIKNKYNNINPIRILFLSNLIPGKGFNELVNAYRSLSKDCKDKVRIDFAGGFESVSDKNEFINKINGLDNIHYHGIVGPNKKKNLLYKTHIFCLPTYYYLLEGQPLSILEAYASGCVVISTNHGGIKDVFNDGINGFEVEKKSSISIKLIIEKIIDSPEQLYNIGLLNSQTAKNKYQSSRHCESIQKIFQNCLI